MKNGVIGIIGGSGLYNLAPECLSLSPHDLSGERGVESVKVLREEKVKTPFGDPSDAIVICEMSGRDVAFLPRHGRGHRILPHEINYRANIFAMKTLGVEAIISVSAVGSMKEDIHPGDLVIVDQFVDRTKCRADTFFGNGIAVHVSFADPVCENLRKTLAMAASKLGVKCRNNGTYVCIEGPMFSSRAESKIYRSWGVDVIGMTNYQEAKLAREAEICFATIALVTDYDCWHVEEGPVDVETIVKTMKDNVSKARDVMNAVLPGLDTTHDCPCRSALKYAIMTDAKAITKENRERLKLLIEKYIQ